MSAERGERLYRTGAGLGLGSLALSLVLAIGWGGYYEKKAVSHYNEAVQIMDPYSLSEFTPLPYDVQRKVAGLHRAAESYQNTGNEIIEGSGLGGLGLLAVSGIIMIAGDKIRQDALPSQQTSASEPYPE